MCHLSLGFCEPLLANFCRHLKMSKRAASESALRDDFWPMPREFMTIEVLKAIRPVVQVQPGGLIEVRAPELQPDDIAEVIVLVKRAPAEDRADLARRLETQFKETQALPAAQTLEAHQ
jgi:hypothetical protein